MQAEEAFKFLMESAIRELHSVQEQGAAFFNKAEFSMAHAAAERAEKLTTLLDDLRRVEQAWFSILPSLPPEPAPVPPPPQVTVIAETHHPAQRASLYRTPNGMRTHQDQFRLPVLAALVEMGGKGRVAAILERVGKLMEPVLNDLDRQLLPGRSDIRWRNSAQWARMEMVKEGYLSANMPNGIWEITSRGREYLKNRAE